MGRALYSSFRYHSPRSTNLSVESPRSPKQFRSSPRSPPYISPRSPHYLGPLSPRYLSPLSPKHPNYLSHPSEPQVFVDAKSKDLPYDLENKMASKSVIFEPCLRLKEQGELLMNFLTGVPGSPLENLASKIHELDAFNLYGPNGGHKQKAHNPSGAQDGKNFLDINRRKVSKKLPSPPSHPMFVDAAVDTMDPEELTNEFDGHLELFWDEQREEARRKVDLEMEEQDGKKPISLQDYLKMVKKLTGRIGLHAQLLHELSLGEDVNMGVPDSELIAVAPLEKLGTKIKPGESSQSKDQETKAIPVYTGAMRATSLVIKRLRRMAGLMHIEQQRVDLKEIYDWLQHLGIVATSSGRTDSSRLGSSAGDSSVKSLNGEKIDWRLPSSPVQALEMAQADLRERLAYIYEEQNQIKIRTEQLEAAKRLVDKTMSKKEVRRLSKYLQNLKTLEVGYEALGGRIVKNLDEAKSLEEQLHKINAKDKLDRAIKEKGGGKERKRDKKARKRGKGSSTIEDEGDSSDSLDKNKSKDTSGGSDTEQLENERSKRKRSKVEKSTKDGATVGDTMIRGTNVEGTSSETKLLKRTLQFGMGRKEQYESSSDRAGIELKQQDTRPSRMVGMKGEAETSTLNNEGKEAPINKEGSLLDPGSRHLNKVKVHKPHIETFDKAMQTENSSLLSLMESMIDAMNEEDPDGLESPAAKLQRLLRENKRMRVQLRFWRSRNWHESTVARLSRLGSRSSSRGGFPSSIRMDSSSEDDLSRDLSLYFNPVRPPSVLSQGQLSLGSSTTEDYSNGNASRRARLMPSSRYDRQRTNRSMIPSSTQPVKYPSIPSASSLNRSNSDILMETLQKASNGLLFSRNRDSQGIQPPPLEPMNAKLRFQRSSHGVQSSGRSTHHSMPSPPVLLEPLNAALLKNTQQGNRQSPPRLHSTNLQPIPDEVLNLALKSKHPSKSPRQLSSRSIPSLKFGGPPEIFPPSNSLSSTSRTPKLSNSLLPLQAVPNSSRVNAQLSPTQEQIKDTSGLQPLPVTQPAYSSSTTQSTTSPRNARNASRNPSPRLAQPMASTQQIHDGQAVPSPSGSPPRSPRRVVTQSRRGGSNARKQPIVEHGLQILGRKSTKE